MAENRFKNIFWDVGAVLFSEAQTSRREFKPILSLLGITSEMSDQIFDELWEHRVRLGKISENDYWRKYLEVSTKKPSLEKIKVVYRSCIRPNENLLQLAQKISGNFDEYILSNHGREWMDYLVSHWQLKKYFKDIFCSAYLGIAKPDPVFYQIAIARSGCVPSETLFIDDNASNIKAAEDLGIRGLLYRNNADLLRSLESVGVRA